MSQYKISEEIRVSTFLLNERIMYSCQLIGFFKDGGGYVRERTLINKGYKNKTAAIKFVDKYIGLVEEYPREV
tara:strand:- start:335 stop:553 length:219 start_codon:yes stop_codon:yes gene_type:complete